jgi:general secretion pathway protein C
MGVDAFFKRYFPMVVCALIGLAAYFQASGMGQLVASTMTLSPAAVPASPGGLRSLPAVAANLDHTTDASAILARNPFDSVTGPLDGRSLDLPEAPAAVGPDNSKDPYDDPLCDTARVILVAAAEDPAWSFAAIAGPDGKSQLRRQGDEVGSQTVFFIGDIRPPDSTREHKSEDPCRLWERVWLTSGSSRCQMCVGGKAPAKGAVDKGKKPASDITSKIHKIGEHEFDVEHAVIDNILENQAELMRSARIVPEKEGDKVVGIRLFGIRPDSLLGSLGLENGDRLQSINGFEMSDPQKALEAYARLRTADHLTVSVNRHGAPINIDFNIK